MTSSRAILLCGDNSPCPHGVMPCNAARNFRNPAPILTKKRVTNLLQQRQRARILELGAGCLRNALPLQKKGHRAWVMELPGVESRFSEQYREFKDAKGTVISELPDGTFDFVLATFVIETICRPEIRARILNDACLRLKSTGCLILSVRGPKDLVTAKAEGKRCSDGYVTPNRTFARSYTRSQLSALLHRCGYKKLEFLHKPSTKEPELVHVIAWKK